MSYWIRPNGVNALKGVPGDLTNPPNTSDVDIIYALQHSRAARLDFEVVFPSLLPEEQARLTALIEDNPDRSKLLRTMQEFLDTDQTRRIREGVRAVGRRGGLGASSRPVGRVL